jgi:hypothetical protein
MGIGKVYKLLLTTKGKVMISKDKIMNTLFYDIETTTRYKTYEEYKEAEPFMADDFEYRVQLKWKKNELLDKTYSEIYHDEAMIYPEHGQVIAISWKIWDGKSFSGDTIGFKDWDDYATRGNTHADKDILIEFNKVMETIFGDENGSLGGYRIKYFDNPFLYKRMLINGIYPHKSLISVGKKPWDIPHLDLYDWWNGVGVNGMAGFGAACEVMGVKNPKEEEISGRQVCYRFWDDHNIQMINEYCMRDVDSSIDFAINLSHDKLTSKYNKTLQEWNERKENENGI